MAFPLVCPKAPRGRATISTLHPCSTKSCPPSESPWGSAGLTVHGPRPLTPQPAPGSSLAPYRCLLGGLQAGPMLCVVLFGKISCTHSVAALPRPPSPCFSPEGTGRAVLARSHASHSPSLPSSPGPAVSPALFDGTLGSSLLSLPVTPAVAFSSLLTHFQPPSSLASPPSPSKFIVIPWHEQAGPRAPNRQKLTAHTRRTRTHGHTPIPRAFP